MYSDETFGLSTILIRHNISLPLIIALGGDGRLREENTAEIMGGWEIYPPCYRKIDNIYLLEFSHEAISSKYTSMHPYSRKYV
jgi:hypothetical protein